MFDSGYSLNRIIMAYKLLFIVIAGISFLIFGMFVVDVLRRLYMSKFYGWLDEARIRYRILAQSFISGSEKEKGHSIELFRKKPGTASGFRFTQFGASVEFRR